AFAPLIFYFRERSVRRPFVCSIIADCPHRGNCSGQLFIRRPKPAAQELAQGALEKSQPALFQQSRLYGKVPPYGGSREKGFPHFFQPGGSLTPPGKIAPAAGGEPGRPC